MTPRVRRRRSSLNAWSIFSTAGNDPFSGPGPAGGVWRECSHGFSSAPNTKPPAELVPYAAAAEEKLKLLWLSCGSQEGLIGISQRLHAHLVEKGVPHIWHVDGHGHDPDHWRSSLYYFAQQLFR